MSRVKTLVPAGAVLLTLALALSPAPSAHASSRAAAPHRALLAEGLAAYARLAAEGRVTNPVLTLIDYGLPSSERRLWVLEPASRRILFHEYVAHGRGSADPGHPERAVRFGNDPGSLRSSLGTFLTGEPYTGVHGWSLRLLGLDPGRNDHAEDRAIVMHPAEYASRAFRLRSGGRLGRSFGCPALDPAAASRVIAHIRSGSVLHAGRVASGERALELGVVAVEVLVEEDAAVAAHLDGGVEEHHEDR
jgi:hypothetical protein